MMRRDHSKKMRFEEDMDEDAYFTYRPLSNLPTPPPSIRDSRAVQSPGQGPLEDGETLEPRYRGPAIHLINLIPSNASLTTASVRFVQAMLSRAALPIETVALAVCILDALDAKFARTWRLSCPLTTSMPSSTTSKRHTLPPTLVPRQLHIDAVRPEIMILAALVIAAKFTEDLQEMPGYYCAVWGKDEWSSAQVNVTERCIMESLGYRIMPLCEEAVLADAMVDMQLAARQHDWRSAREPSPPMSNASGEEEFVPSHGRSKTMVTFGFSGLSIEEAISPLS